MLPAEHTPDRQPEELWVCDLGTVAYRRALTIQERVRELRQADEIPDVLLLLEHPPVYTRGRRSAVEELPLGESFYRDQGIEILATDRGGRVTYHGPGQLVGYPIMQIGDIGSYLRTMEAAIVATLATEGIVGRSRCEEGADYTGVWVAERKIASIGVHVSHSITTHGFAVNVQNDLEPFSWVVACGLPDVAMTSVKRELEPGHRCDPHSFRRRMARSFCEVHGRRERCVPPRALGIEDLLADPSSSHATAAV
jgi:lipoyl(octanoyl) transferase